MEIFRNRITTLRQGHFAKISSRPFPNRSETGSRKISTTHALMVSMLFDQTDSQPTCNRTLEPPNRRSSITKPKQACVFHSPKP